MVICMTSAEQVRYNSKGQPIRSYDMYAARRGPILDTSPHSTLDSRAGREGAMCQIKT